MMCHNIHDTKILPGNIIKQRVALPSALISGHDLAYVVIPNDIKAKTNPPNQNQSCGPLHTNIKISPFKI